MRVTALALLTFALLTGGFHLADIYGREKLLAAHSGDLRKAAQLIFDNYAPDIRNCPKAGHRDDIHRLADALATVENYSTSKLEQLIENNLTRSAHVIGGRGFDFSLGLAQIRRSTIEKILAKENHQDLPFKTQSHQLSASILKPCTNLKLARMVVADIMIRQKLILAELEHDAVTAIAAEYNGQTHSSSLATIVPHTAYNEIVYNIFQIYRFESLTPSAQSLSE